jgi:hypothetical protein
MNAMQPTQIFPAKAEHWVGFVLSLLKIYVVAAYLVWGMFDLYVQNGNNPSIAPPAMRSGYFLCLIVLVFAAGIQLGTGRREMALRTGAFILIGTLFLLMSLQVQPFWLWMMVFATNIVINGSVLLCALAACRHFKMRAFTFWIWACSINLVREIGIVLCKYPYAVDKRSLPLWRLMNDLPAGNFLEFYWIGFIVAGVLWAAGSILVIRHVLTQGRAAVSTNTAMLAALSVLVLLIGMALSFSLFQSPSLIPTAAIGGVVFFFSLAAYCRHRTPAFAFLVVACAINIVRTAVMAMHHSWPEKSGSFVQLFFELLSLGGVISGVLWGVGNCLLIQRVTEMNPKFEPIAEL